jgi:hypothetical protein
MKKLLLVTTIILFISINLYPQTPSVGNWTGEWKETCFCGDTSDYTYKLHLFNGTTLSCDHVGFYPYGNEGEIQTCEVKGKVIYQSKIILNYKCFKKVRVGDSEEHKYPPADSNGGIQIIKSWK